MTEVDCQERARLVKSAISLPTLIGGYVKLKPVQRDWIGLCPFHGERTPSFVVYHDHYYCYGCGANGDVINWIMRVHRLGFREAVERLTAGADHQQSVRESLAPVSPVPRSDRAMHQELARRIWVESVDAAGTLLERYFQSRGLELPSGRVAAEPSVIRFHPGCPCGQDRFPAMISRMDDAVSGHPSGILRTFIKPDGSGKADVPSSKMMLGGGGVIRLYDWQNDGLAICEGVETGLAIAQRLGWLPIWAVGSTSTMSALPVLPGVALTIFSDNDCNGSGQRAADACARRWADAGAEVWITTPPLGDWDDVTRSIVA
jgi:DNA primase